MNFDKFEEIIRKGYSLDIIYVLNQIKAEEKMVPSDVNKVVSIYQFLERKGLVLNGKVTPEGEKLLDFFENEEVTKMERVPVKEKNEEFEKWWKIYPSTDMFEHKGKTFKGTQKKNIRKDECKRIFSKYVSSGEFSKEDIIEATKYHIEVAKELSVKKGSNQLSFIPNSERYLREKMFEPYITLCKNIKNNKEESNTTETII